jgi:hypothetical protein
MHSGSVYGKVSFVPYKSLMPLNLYPRNYLQFLLSEYAQVSVNNL